MGGSVVIWRCPEIGVQIIHFDSIFHDEPFILGYTHLWNPPYEWDSQGQCLFHGKLWLIPEWLPHGVSEWHVETLMYLEMSARLLICMDQDIRARGSQILVHFCFLRCSKPSYFVLPSGLYSNDAWSRHGHEFYLHGWPKESKEFRRISGAWAAANCLQKASLNLNCWLCDYCFFITMMLSSLFCYDSLLLFVTIISNIYTDSISNFWK